MAAPVGWLCVNMCKPASSTRKIVAVFMKPSFSLILSLPTLHFCLGLVFLPLFHLLSSFCLPLFPLSSSLAPALLSDPLVCTPTYPAPPPAPRHLGLLCQPCQAQADQWQWGLPRPMRLKWEKLEHTSLGRGFQPIRKRHVPVRTPREGAQADGGLCSSSGSNRGLLRLAPKAGLQVDCPPPTDSTCPQLLELPHYSQSKP